MAATDPHPGSKARIRHFTKWQIRPSDTQEDQLVVIDSKCEARDETKSPGQPLYSCLVHIHQAKSPHREVTPNLILLAANIVYVSQSTKLYMRHSNEWHKVS